MTEWRNWHLYYSDLDKILRECVGPAISGHPGPDCLFWIRHYFGGSHLRIRAHGGRDALASLSENLVKKVSEYIALNPSSPSETYSVDRATTLLQIERGQMEGCDASYRINELIECPYDRSLGGMPSLKSLELLESFLSSTNRIAMMILSSPKDKYREALRLYFGLLLCSTGSLRRGGVSAKSHWSGFAAFRLDPTTKQTIERSYEKNFSVIHACLEEAVEVDSLGSERRDEILRQWHQVLESHRTRVIELHRKGHELCFSVTAAQADLLKQRIGEEVFAQYPFLSRLWSDPRFLGAMRSDPHLAVPRALTNLYYSFISSQLGLRAIDKITLCYFVFQSIEDHYSCDLTGVLEGNIAAAIARNGAGSSSVVDINAGP